MEKHFPCNVLHICMWQQQEKSRSGWRQNREETAKKLPFKKTPKIVAVAFCTHHWGSMECAHTDTKCRHVSRLVYAALCFRVCIGHIFVFVLVFVCVSVRMAIKQKVCMISIRIFFGCAFDLYFVCELAIVRFFGENVPRPLSKSKGFPHLTKLTQRYILAHTLTVQ